MKKKPTKIVELVIEENNEMLAIDAISLVSAPAIEENFVYFGKEKHNLTFAKVDEDKRMLVSPALIPNKQIFRYNPQTDSEYYVYFSKDTVRQAAELYLKHNNHHKATYEHQDRVSGVLTTESWIKEGDMDKSKMYGFDLPNGTWFVKMRIDNDDLWNKIKEGELKGLSIEGYFVDKMQKMSDNKPTDHEILSALNEIIRETNKPQKVELALVDDLVKDAKRLSSKYEKAVKNHMAIAKLVNENFKEMASLVKAAKKGYGFVSTIDKQFKKLGVKPSKQYKKASQEIFDIAEGSGEQMLKDLAKFKGLL
tara:strand:- start:2099 stop:3025 length:927 start_codon:yes stop_codon:yes gene_type:complete